eukprot:CAMPEP_0197177326 /NCGR_PEP_ID=MMETSP1423-20130617/2968_1 /TAXON_ID=476441 /ORGANISM="Pseudo-nitzschia heimii, Strain UNC1101" /LENGTH=404 /DNA_ID=CAMNT_0042626853 /DNA_START=125 /DNA_END=1339 /DNA_ORIENTATION=-
MAAQCVRSFNLGFASPKSRFAALFTNQSTRTSWKSLSKANRQSQNGHFLKPRFSSRLFFSSNQNTGEKKRVVFLGTPEVAATTLRSLYEDSIGKYEIVCVITQPPKRRRRKGKAEPSSVGAAAEELGLPILSPEKANEKEFLDRLENEIKPDLFITAAYGQYLPKRFLAMPSLGTINIHPSLLPKWRGASPVQRSLEAGDNPIGVTVLYTVSKMDAGPIIAQKEDRIQDVNADDAKATNVLPRLFEIGTDLLIENLPDVFSGEMSFDKAKPQDEDLVVQATMIHSSEAEMKPWEETAATLHNRLRGFSMWPGAFLYLEVGEGSEPVKYKIIETRLLEEERENEPTEFIKRGPSKKDGLRLVCFDGSILEINRLQPATKKPVDALSFINGLQGRTVRYVKTPEDK